ncbi:MAG: PAQR family membrane homeostasis protein TrhA [Thermoguttaceae bacterium]
MSTTKIDLEEKQPEPDFTLSEEIYHTFTHAIGGYLGVAAIVLMLVFGAQSQTQVAWKIVAASIYGSTIILMYTVSSAYHAITHTKAKYILNICDHAAIYFLIAGSYTPFCLVALRPNYPGLAWTVFGLIWAIGITGVVLKVFLTGKFVFLSTVAYIAMGWISIFMIRPLYEVLSFGGIVWLVLGGVLYTVGTIFFLWKIMPFHHVVWHLFVLAGTTCHFFCVLFYVMM